MAECMDEGLWDHFFEGIYVVDKSRTITSWNRGAERITGWKAQEVLGKRCSDNILRHIDYHGRELCVLGCPLHASLLDGQFRESNAFLHHKDGHRVPVAIRVIAIRDDDGNLTGAMELFVDNTRRMDYMRKIESLQKEAMTDALTAIGNRRFADMVLDRAWHDLAEHGVPFGVVMVDIDHFKLFNDRYGHAMGDKMLVMCSQSMLQAIRSADSLCRWGGEEFIAIVPNCDPGSLKAIAERLRFLVEQSWIDEAGEKLTATVSVGATIAVKEDGGVAAVVARSDKLLYASKDSGRNIVTCG